MIKDALLTCYERDVNPKIVRLWAKLNERITIKVKTGVGESQKVKVGAVVGQGTIGGALVRQAVLDEGVNDKKIFLPQMDKVGFGIADFPAVFFHISHWYLSWNTAGGGNCI